MNSPYVVKYDCLTLNRHLRIRLMGLLTHSGWFLLLFCYGKHIKNIQTHFTTRYQYRVINMIEYSFVYVDLKSKTIRKDSTFESFYDSFIEIDATRSLVECGVCVCLCCVCTSVWRFPDLITLVFSGRLIYSTCNQK